MDIYLKSHTFLDFILRLIDISRCINFSFTTGRKNHQNLNRDSKIKNYKKKKMQLTICFDKQM